MGRNVKEYLVNRGYDVYAPASRELDCIDERSVAACLREGHYDIVLHFAVYGDAIDKSKDGTKSLEYNLRIFHNFRVHSDLYGKSIKGLPLSMRRNCYFDYLWIDDFCRMLELFLQLDKPQHHTYNAVRGERIDLYTLAKLVNEAAGTPQPILVCQEGYANEYTANNDRILKELLQMRFTDIRDSVGALYDWYRRHEDEIYG